MNDYLEPIFPRKKRKQASFITQDISLNSSKIIAKESNVKTF